MTVVLTFEEAINTVEANKRHVLLGNGFSLACRKDIFAYDALFDRADFDDLSASAKDAFGALATSDFEIVMRALRNAGELVKLYSPSETVLASRLIEDANGLREVLVKAIADSHPAWPGEIKAEEYASCRSFLANFNKIYTVNYDLLLYWTLMQENLEPKVPCDDGFRKPEDQDANYVTWEPENSRSQNVHYLHGALHVFDAGSEIQKYTWVNTGVRLIAQIRKALEDDLYPLFVAEAESKDKRTRIRHSDFLAKALRSLLCIGGALFVYGHSFAENDAHILETVLKSKVNKLFVGLFGEHDSSSNQDIVCSAESLAARRPEAKPLAVHFYDAGTANVWDAPAV